MTDRIIVYLLSLHLLSTALSAGAAPTEVSQTAGCRIVERHVPDVDVTYQPGKDIVAGKPVMPADLDGGAAAITVPQQFDIEIDAPLGQDASGAQQQPMYRPNAKIGKVTVSDLEGDTAITFNGQPLYRTPPGASSPECAR
jgi:hypothetical protein